MLAALLLAGLVAAPVSSRSTLFARRRRGAGGAPGGRPGGWCWPCSAPCCWPPSSAGVLRRCTRPGPTIAAVAGVVAMSLLWLPATRRWNARAHLRWAGDDVPVRRLPRLHAVVDVRSATSASPARSAAWCCGCWRPSPRCWASRTSGSCATRSAREQWPGDRPVDAGGRCGSRRAACRS